MTRMPESRVERRRSVDLRATVSLEQRVLTVRTRDISRSGICLIGDAEIPRDTDLEIDLVLTFGAETRTEPLSLTGRAVWCTKMFGKFQIGVKFVDVDMEKLRFLDLFMRFMDGEITGEEIDASAFDSDPDDPFQP